MTARLLALPLLLAGCQLSAQADEPSPTATTDGLDAMTPEDSTILDLLGQYTTVRLDADLSGLSDSTRAMLPHLIAAARAMDDIFWQQAYGDRDSLLAGLSEPARRYATINVGPWDRLDGNAPFLPGVGEKPLGSNLYPHDLSKDQLLAAADLYPEENLTGLYTIVRRQGGRLVGIPYHVAFEEPTARAATHLRAAADLAQDEGLRTYLRLRADALLSDDYQASDLAWMDMRTNPLDIVIGPIETYEDALAGFKAGAEAYVLVKDLEWSDRLAGYARLLPELQRGLPVPDAYKTESPGSDADLGAYDVVFVAGEANAGSKTIAINLPNDEAVQLAKGSRRLQLKNVMRAKFDRILVPMAELILPEDQQDLVTFDAFFGNTMFHEVAHGLGIKNTIDGAGTVREALQDRYSALEEGKADVLGLYMVQQLADRGDIYKAYLAQRVKLSETDLVVKIIEPLLRALEHAHARGVIHRCVPHCRLSMAVPAPHQRSLHCTAACLRPCPHFIKDHSPASVLWLCMDTASCLWLHLMCRKILPERVFLAT